MTANRLLCSASCVAWVATLLFAPSGSPAFASRTHILQPNETLFALARKYGVTVSDIEKANHLKNVDSVPDFTKLHIPDAPKQIKASPQMRRAANLLGDRVSVRFGPGESHRRKTFLDNGAPVVVTAKRAGWAQIELSDGSLGWVRADFLAYRNGSRLAAVPKPTVAAKPKKVTIKAAKAAKKKPVRVARQESKRVAKLARSEKTRAQKQKALRVAKAESRQRAARSYRQTRRIAEAPAPPATTDVVRTAYSFRGTPYRYGGSGRGGFDCSGFTSYLYGRKGVALPHSASGQFQRGKKVGRGEMKPGDLVFFQTVTKGISHVGVYVGNGRFVHSSSRRSGGVRVDSLDSGYYNQRFRGAKRVHD